MMCESSILYAPDQRWVAGEIQRVIEYVADVSFDVALFSVGTINVGHGVVEENWQQAVTGAMEVTAGAAGIVRDSINFDRDLYVLYADDVESNKHDDTTSS